MSEPTETPEEWPDPPGTGRTTDEGAKTSSSRGSAPFGGRSDPPGKRSPEAHEPGGSSPPAEFRGWGVTDRPTDVDSLGFVDVVDVLEAFLTDENTTPPLTVAIEGEWGTGKSSFMRMLMKRLGGDGPPPSYVRALGFRLREVGTRLYRTLARAAGRDPGTGWDERTGSGSGGDHLVVFFDPWRHDSEEAIWAAFALEFLRQIRRQLLWHRRLLGDVELAVRRVEWERGRSGLLVSGLLTVGTAVLVLLAAGGLFLLGQAGAGLALGSVLSETDAALAEAAAGGSGLTLSLVALLSVWSRARRRVFDPLRADLDRYLSDPGYEERVSFVARFNEDFGRIVEAYRGDRSVFVFIDDLDRCSLPRAAELMGALTLLLESEPKLFFLLGMDREKVAAGIAARHGGIYKYLYDAEGGADSERHLGLRFGAEYLEKFVQVRVRIPQPGPDSLDAFFATLDPAYEPELSRAPSFEPPLSLVGNPRDEEVRNAVRVAAPLLDYKPRSLKTFINQYRLEAMLAFRRGWLDRATDADGSERDGVTYEELALSVAEWLAAEGEISQSGAGGSPTEPATVGDR